MTPSEHRMALEEIAGALDRLLPGEWYAVPETRCKDILGNGVWFRGVEEEFESFWANVAHQHGCRFNMMPKQGVCWFLKPLG